MKTEKFTCDYCGNDIPTDEEWHLSQPLGLREPFSVKSTLHACIGCMSELEAKRKAREGEAA